ncbi:DUF4440 domain-containing protein [Pluralibacter gergoviae]
MNPYFEEVLDVHLLIRRWFSEPGCPQAIYNELIARFSDDFAMVSPGGLTLDYSRLETLFLSLRGAKPGLDIDISQMRIVAEHPGGATVTYAERQTLSGGDATLRYSVAVFAKAPGERIIWHYLQETLAA